MKKCKCGVKTCKNKNLDLVSRFTCNLCNSIYCPDHRHYETHDCSVYKSQKNESQLFSGEFEKYLILHNMNKIFDDVAKNKDIKVK
jgi:hypothetical protein